jgi:hypothetical protein
MNVIEIVCRMQGAALVTIVDYNKDILIDCATADRILAFDDIDEDIHRIMRRCKVWQIEVGKEHGDIILHIVNE